MHTRQDRIQLQQQARQLLLNQLNHKDYAAYRERYGATVHDEVHGTFRLGLLSSLLVEMHESKQQLLHSSTLQCAVFCREFVSIVPSSVFLQQQAYIFAADLCNSGQSTCLAPWLL